MHALVLRLSSLFHVPLVHTAQRLGRLRARNVQQASTPSLELNTVLLFPRDGEARRLEVKLLTLPSVLRKPTLTLEKKTALHVQMGSCAQLELVSQVNGNSHALKVHTAKLVFRQNALQVTSVPWSVPSIKLKAAPSALLALTAFPVLLTSCSTLALSEHTALKVPPW